MSTGLTVVLLDTSIGANRRIVATRDDEEYGYAIARWFKQADNIAAALGHEPLRGFVFEDVDLHEAAVEMAEQDGDAELAASLRAKLERARRQPEWHDATQGLATIRAVLGAVRDDNTQVCASEVRTTKAAVIWDLEAIEAILAEAVSTSMMFRFEAI
jgi:hypothetical protein